MIDKETYQEILDLRGVQTPCERCSGFGYRAYGSTSTWRGGIGGSAITGGVCDHCWGSGDQVSPWPSWRAHEAAVVERDEARAVLELCLEAGMQPYLERRIRSALGTPGPE